MQISVTCGLIIALMGVAVVALAVSLPVGYILGGVTVIMTVGMFGMLVGAWWHDTGGGQHGV